MDDLRPSAAKDFNADGFADLIWENTIGGQRSIWLTNRGVPFTRTQSRVLTLGKNVMIIALKGLSGRCRERNDCLSPIEISLNLPAARRSQSFVPSGRVAAGQFPGYIPGLNPDVPLLRD
jgi:hypothetical protein